MVPLKILVIDDDDLSRELLQMLLVRAGYSTTTASSGDAAIALLRDTEALPGVMLVDLQMPGISGSTLAGRLRELCPAGRLLAMSGSQPADDALHGFDRFLLKPFTLEMLSAAIANKGSAAAQPESVIFSSPRQSVILDGEVHRKLQTAMKPEKLVQLYSLCLDDVRRRISVMRAAAGSGDDAAYRREAHAIKGGCGMVGAVELQTIAASGENAGIPANHVATLDEFLRAADRLERMLFANRQSLESTAVIETARSNA